MKNIPTKQKILECAVDLFAVKGFTETTIRELAAAVGLKEASIYNHFPSKNAILEYIIDEYSQFTRPVFGQEKIAILKENPTVEGILSCMNLSFPEDRALYFLKELYVLLHEQHRNPIVREFMTGQYILGNEHVVRMIITTLKDIGALRPDTDPDFWVKIHSSIIYTFASRLMMGIGDSDPGFSGNSMVDMLYNTYDLLLKTFGINAD